MADVAVLQPQSILPPHHHHRHKPHRKPKPNNRRRNSPPRPTQARPITPSMSGPIRILKRGEEMPVTMLHSKPMAQPEPVMRVDEPEPVMRVDEPEPVMRVDEPEPVMRVGEPEPLTTVDESDLVTRVDWFYAGSGFVTSPPPSSVPFPAFFTAGKRNCGGVTTTEADNIATGLRRLLNLR